MTLFNVLKELEKANKEDFLMTLYHHFESQANPQTPKCNSEYYGELAHKCLKLNKAIEQM